MPLQNFATPSVNRTPVQARGTESVLAVDDNEAIREIIFTQLTSLGYRVTQAASGDEALALLERSDGGFDLLVSDIMMPGDLDGVALAKIARARWPELGVLLVSGFAGSFEAEEDAAAFPFLQKPFRKPELARAVRRALVADRDLQAAAE